MNVWYDDDLPTAACRETRACVAACLSAWFQPALVATVMQQ
mgnify:CR=1 FL=1